ncbi:MAG: hypothetical protein LLF98_14130 [Clostridium sp.]|uniref:hypothetical protein n=1 Tax=Clostridium sp. TaxID=1506 RepID=UPI0025BCB737|nr:hypothetical protein [Clostridium sp.]MCE5222343.1 hypothetical protein [Clostridium sp.]
MMYFFELYNSLDGKEKVTFVGIIITFVGVFFTFIAGVVNIYISQKKLSIENITSNRVEWINTLRKYVSDFIIVSDLNNIQSMEVNKTSASKFREDLLRASSLIKLHLNFKGVIDKRILIELEEAINKLNLFVHLRLINKAMNIENSKSGLKLYFDKYTDSNLLDYLINYYNKDNEVIESSINSNQLALKELKKTIIDKYFMETNGEFYGEKFKTEIDSQLDSIIEQVGNSRYNIIKLTQIYLKSEWIRVKKESKAWPFNIYFEKHIIKKLETEWDEFNSNLC